MSNSHKYIIVGLGVVLVIAGGAFFALRRTKLFVISNAPMATSNTTESQNTESWKKVEFKDSGIGFSVPPSWSVFPKTEAHSFTEDVIAMNNATLKEIGPDSAQRYDASKNGRIEIYVEPQGTNFSEADFLDLEIGGSSKKVSLGETTGYKMVQYDTNGVGDVVYAYRNNYIYKIWIMGPAELRERLLSSVRIGDASEHYTIENAYIKNAYLRGGKHYIDADFIQELSGKPLVIYYITHRCDLSPSAQADAINRIKPLDPNAPDFLDRVNEITGCGIGGSPAGGFWEDINDNPKIRTLQLSDDVVIAGNDALIHPGGQLGIVSTTPDVFVAPYWHAQTGGISRTIPNGSPNYMWENNPWSLWINSDGTIDALIWQYRP